MKENEDRMMSTNTAPEKRPRPLPEHISTGPLGRALFGLGAFVVSLAFGAYAVFLAVMLVKAAQPVVLWRIVVAHVIIDLFAVASIFMLLLAVSFWAGGSRWADPLLYRIMPKALVAIAAILTANLLVVGVAFPPLGVVEAVTCVIAILIILLMRIWTRGRLDQEK